jgi:hypothetical protein
MIPSPRRCCQLYDSQFQINSQWEPAREENKNETKTESECPSYLVQYHASTNEFELPTGHLLKCYRLVPQFIHVILFLSCIYLLSVAFPFLNARL